MWPVLLLLAVTLPPAEVSEFAARVAQSAAQTRDARAGARVLVRVEDRAGLGAADQIARALRDALRQRGLEPVSDGETAAQVGAYLVLRSGRPLAVARVSSETKEPAVHFTEFFLNQAIEPAPAAAPAVAIRTRTLFASDLPILDVEADPSGNIFVLHSDRVRVYDLNSPGLPLKAEVGVETGAERLRDPLVRLIAREAPRYLEVYSAAATVPAAPPLPIEGYMLKTFAAATPLKLLHPWRAVLAAVQPVAGRNYFRAAGISEVHGVAPVVSPLRAHWVLLDGAGRLLLADADLRLIAGAVSAGPYGGDVTTVALDCSGMLVLAASAEANPERDRISVLRVDSDRLAPYTSLELEGAVRRLKALPLVGDQRRVLAVVETLRGTRLEEIELRCSP